MIRADMTSRVCVSQARALSPPEAVGEVISFLEICVFDRGLQSFDKVQAAREVSAAPA